MSMAVGATPAAGIEAAVWIAFGIAVAASLVGVAIWIAGRAGLHRPEIETWLRGEKPAIESSPLAGRSKGD